MYADSHKRQDSEITLRQVTFTDDPESKACVVVSQQWLRFNTFIPELFGVPEASPAEHNAVHTEREQLSQHDLIRTSYTPMDDAEDFTFMQSSARNAPIENKDQPLGRHNQDLGGLQDIQMQQDDLSTMDPENEKPPG